MHKYRKYIGKSYEEPHGCFYLVADVFLQEYRVNLGRLDEPLLKYDPYSLEARQARAQQVHKVFGQLTEEVKRGDVREGDVVLIRSNPYHIGVMLNEKEMLHSFRGSGACIERIDALQWRNRILGFHRYKSGVSDDQGQSVKASIA